MRILYIVKKIVNLAICIINKKKKRIKKTIG